VPGSTVVGGELEELRELIDWSRAQGSRLGYFAALYTHVGLAVEHALAGGEFQHPRSLQRLNDVFFARYLAAFRAHRDGQTTSGAWAAAFKAAASRRPCIIQHLMLGMNAHINLDLAIAVAEAIPPAELDAFHADFDHMNGLLSGLVDTITKDIARAWPFLRWINQLFRQEDDLIIEFSMQLARDHAWEGARRLSALAGEERQQAIRELDADATEIADAVAHPRALAHLVALIVRAQELRRSVARIIDDLLAA